MLNFTALNTTLVRYIEPTFTIADYVVFALFLGISGAVGIFFSCRGQKDTDEYFYGGKKMKPVPVGISTGVSFLASGVMVGLPAEVFIYGSSYTLGTVFGCLGFLAGCLTVSYLLQPRGITSVNEYIAKRFNNPVLTYTANILVLLCIFEYMGICILGTVIAFNSVTGGKVSVVSGLIIGGAVGIFYTSIGGLKAVVWTDVIQSVIMIGGTIVVIIKSMIDTSGGMAEIVNLNIKYGRFHEPIWSADLTIRHTMWGLIFGFFVYWGIWCIQPACVQRLCSTRTKRDSYIVAVIASALFLCFTLLPGWAGINIFAYYYQRGCDINAAGWIKDNEIILYYVRERLQWPGFQGLFIAALYSGSLSSLSSGLNAGSALLWKDTIKPLLKVEVSEIKATFISKIIVVVFGVLSMIWCYTLHSFGGMILQVAASIDASMYGTYFGLFLLAMLFRHANHKGALVAIVFSFSATLWLGLCSLLYGKSKKNDHLPKVMDNCASTNFTLKSPPVSTNSSDSSSPFLSGLYSVSYIWLCIICIVSYLLIAMIVTGCTGGVSHFDENLLLPFARKGFWSKKFNRLRGRTERKVVKDYEDDDDEMVAEKKFLTSNHDTSSV